jgi:inorganic phosphate transporter, PiT family
MSIEFILIGIVILAGFYLAWNIGANDVANAMGTSVGSGALTLKQAVFVAAILEFSGAFFFGSHVSDTVQNGIVDSSIFVNNPIVLVYGMLAALLAAGVWLQIASYFGWPVSTTHSIVGAIIGFGAVVGGWEAIYWENVTFIVSSWIVSPIMGGCISYLIFTILRKKILYTENPFESAKKLTPFIVFLVIFTLSLIMVFDGLQNVNLFLTPFQGMGISLLVGMIASLISWFLVRRIETSFITKTVSSYNPEMALSLDKAKKHLQRVKSSCKGEMEFQTEVLLESVESLSHALKRSEDAEAVKSEYTAVENIFGYLQIMSACMMAFAHGANDVANAIGPLSAAMIVLTTHTIPATASVPIWALALGGFGIVVGLATWGWRVIETIGKKITELTPTRGFAAEFGAAVTVVLASQLGMPISTTHTLVGSVIGVGLARGIEALNLSMTRDIVVSWIVTVPAGAGIAVLFFYIIEFFFV